MNKIIPSLISIVNLKIIESTILSNLECSEGNQGIIDHVNYNFEVNNAFSIEDKLVKVDLTVMANAKDKNDHDVDARGKFRFEFIFFIKNFDDLFDKENNSISFELGVTLISIAYSSTRGLIYAKVSGTALKNLILPIINPSDLLKQNENLIQ